MFILLNYSFIYHNKIKVIKIFSIHYLVYAIIFRLIFSMKTSKNYRNNLMRFYDLRIAKNHLEIPAQAVTIWLKCEYLISARHNKFIQARLEQLSYHRVINVRAISCLMINLNAYEGHKRGLIWVQGVITSLVITTSVMLVAVVS